jgi:threonine dehydratase
MPYAYFASAYDDKLVIEGNATLGAELAGKDFDIVVSPVGGGGLSSGIITGLRRSGSQAEVFGAEPLLGNDAAQSLAAGRLIANETEPVTIADGARTISLGDLNWEILRNEVAGIVEVDDDAIKQAVRLYFQLANLKCEPTGALSLGAVLSKPELFRDKRICLVVSGGNVDPAVYSEIIS